MKGTTVTTTRIGSALLLLLLAACGDGSAQGKKARESIRDARYCEFAVFFIGAGEIKSDSWNTSALNDCPAAQWEALDFDAIRNELGATALRPNGPRHWLFDAGVQFGREDLERRFFGGIEFALVAHVQVGFPPPTLGTYFFDVRVERDTEFRFYAGRPVYELIAPLGKRYVMQSYARYVDPTLTIDDLDSIGPRISVPAGWEYRVRILSEDLLVDDFQGFATVMRDPLENSYQRAEALEDLPAGWVAVDLFDEGTMQSWTAFLTDRDADELRLSEPWQRSDQIGFADKIVYSRSPGAELDGRFQQRTIEGFTFSLSARAVVEPTLDPTRRIRTGRSRKFQELTYRAGRTIAYVRNPDGENFVLASNAPGASSESGPLPPGWSHGEVRLSRDWRIVFEGAVDTVQTAEGDRIYEGPVSLPGGAR